MNEWVSKLMETYIRVERNWLSEENNWLVVLPVFDFASSGGTEWMAKWKGDGGGVSQDMVG